MTPRKVIETVLRGGHVGKIPFKIYEHTIPQCTVEREFRDRGMCIVMRTCSAVKTHMPNVKVRRQFEMRDGKERIRTYYDTPKGTLTSLIEQAGFTSWTHEKLFKSPDDYPAILALFRDEVYEENYKAFLAE